MNLNKVFLLGRLTADPQLRTTPNGHQVATFSIATNRVWNDKVAGKREEVEFHNIVVWARQAEIASKFLFKGSLVLIEGRLQTRTWEDNQGQKRRTTEIVADRLQLGPRSTNIGQGGQGGQGFNSSPPPSPSPSQYGGGQPSSGSQPQPQSQSEIPTIDIDESVPVDKNEIKKEDLPF